MHCIPLRIPRYSLCQARIQDSEGGGVVHSEGGGGSYRNFRSGSKLLQGPGQINKQKKIADSRRGGVPITPTKPLYPRMFVYAWYVCIICHNGPNLPA